MKLKTLKDLKFFWKNPKNKKVVEYVEYPDLKQEAIKWVKKLQKEADLFSMPAMLGERDSVIEFKNFFNITEEDLK